MSSVKDGGWAWFVLLGVHVSIIMSNGYLTTLGIFFNEWKDYFEASATASSLLISLPWLVASPISLFVGILALRFGIRRVAMVGGAVNGLATILGSFANDITHLYASNAMAGVGTVMVVSSGAIILAQYFNRRYVFANGLAVLGLNIGQIVFSLLIRLLISSFGWRGAMFVIGAVQMNGVVACALFRPFKLKTDSVSEFQDTRNPGSRPSADDVKQCHDGACTDKLMSFVKLFGNFHALLILLANCFQSMGLMMNLAHLPSRGKEAGLSDTQSALLLFVFGVSSCVTRLLHGWFVDNDYINPFKLQLVVLIGTALTTFMNPVSNSQAFLTCYAICLGAFLGVGVPLMIANMKSVVSISEVPTALTMMWATFYLFGGIGIITAGKIFDATGNYIAPFLTGGAVALMAFLLFAIVAIKEIRQGTIHRQL